MSRVTAGHHEGCKVMSNRAEECIVFSFLSQGLRVVGEGPYRMVASVVRQSSVRRPSSTFSKDFSKTTKPISIQFHMQPSGKRGKMFMYLV